MDMGEMILSVNMTQRTDTSENWNKNNPILKVGEIGYDLTNKLFKIGDGESTWDSLSYYLSEIDGGTY